MFKKKLSLQLTAGFVAIVLISMLAVGISFMQMFKQYIFESREHTMLERARSVAEMMNENSHEGTMRGFAGLIRFLDTMTEADVWITDSKGSPYPIYEMGQSMSKGKGMGQGLRHGVGQGAGHNYDFKALPAEAEDALVKVLQGSEFVGESFSDVYEEATLTVGVPIVNDNKQVIGSVLLHSPITGVSAILNKAVTILNISLLGALLLAIGLGIFYSLIFTRPLKAMNRMALEVKQGNYAFRTGVNRRDELGQLADSLDRLANELGSTINQLFQEKGKLKDILSSISEGLIAFDKEFRLMSVNAALGKIMNRPQLYLPEQAEKDLRDLEIMPWLVKTVEDKASFEVMRDWMNKKLKFTFSPVIDNLGVVTGSVALVQDVTQGERLEQLRRDFVANVSHEFRTPLTVIRGSLEALADGTVKKREEMLRYHQRMLSETRGLERLVEDLLELSLLQSGKITMNKEELYIPDLLEDAVRSIRTIAEKKKITIEYRSVSDVPPFIGDYDRLRQLFVIFLDNAVKYSPQHTIVSVETRLSHMNTLLVSIQDQGYGIDSDKLIHIWDRFYKIDKSRKGQGTGLGLAIAKHLAQLQGVELSVQSELNKGTSVEIRLTLDSFAG